MSVWREVIEALFARWESQWVAGDPPEPLTPYHFANEQGFDPPSGPWARLHPVRLPGGPGTMGSPGNRKMTRVGLLVIDLREPAGKGVGSIADLGERAAAIYENCRILATHDIRFGEVEPRQSSGIEGGRWWGVTIEARFEYEDII